MVLKTPAGVPQDLLARSDKILFIAHLAIGDFVYLQNCLRAFANAFPHIKIHLWVDELRRTSQESKWEDLKNYVVYDWVESSPFIHKVYRRTYSPALFRESVREAQAEKYPIVISFGLLRRKFYANLARKISPKALIAGQVKPYRFYDLLARSAYQKLDIRIPQYVVNHEQPAHISDVYAGWFLSLFGCGPDIAERDPFVNIPQVWKDCAELQFREWRIEGRPVLFLNSYSKGEQRTWPIGRMFDLIREVRKNDRWSGLKIILNVVPEEYSKVDAMLGESGLRDVHLFSATKNFFQLPAILERCSLVVTVETAIMHLANAVHVPVIALMRKANPEWRPYVEKMTRLITVSGIDDWIRTIQISDVMEVLMEKEFSKMLASRNAPLECKTEG